MHLDVSNVHYAILCLYHLFFYNDWNVVCTNKWKPHSWPMGNGFYIWLKGCLIGDRVVQITKQRLHSLSTAWYRQLALECKQSVSVQAMARSYEISSEGVRHATRLQFIMYVRVGLNYQQERWYFFTFFAPWWPNTDINMTEMLYPIDFMICHKFAIHCVCKLWTGTMILWFCPNF